MLDTLLHKILHIPYTLHAQVIKKARKPRATIVLIHGIGNSGAVWDEIIGKLPTDVRIITVDLLGFGDSPKPMWATYDARRQAQSLRSTLRRIGRFERIHIIGHSLGAIVGVEYASLYPGAVSSLTLCSPPFYKENNELSRLPNATKLLKRVYKHIIDRPHQFVKVMALAQKYGLVTKHVDVNDKNIESYVGALHSSILNQTSFDDIQTLTIPITIIHGRLDVLTVSKYLDKIAKTMPTVTMKNVTAGHEISKAYITPVIKAVLASLNTPKVRYNGRDE